MRCSHPEHARTFLCITLFFVLSFTATLAESANVHGFRAHHAWRKRAPLDVIPRDQVPTLTTSLLPSIAGVQVLTSVLTTAATPTSVPSVVLPTLPSPSTPPAPSLPSPPADPLMTTSSSSSSTSPSTPTSTSATSTTVRTTSINGTPVSQSTPSQSTSSQSSSSSQTSSSAKPSTSTGAAAVVATTPAAQTLGLTSEYSGAGAVTGYATGTTTSSTPSSTSESSSNSGFFSNTGAVAGTFTVAGLLGVAGVIGAGMMIARRRISRSYEDDMEYLEKKPEPSVHSQSQNFVVGEAEESADSDHFDNSMEITVPPAAHFYPQQDAYFAHGQAANNNEGYENQGYYPQEVYAPHEYGMAYPPAEPYVAEDPYGGMDEAYVGMPNPFDDAGSELPAALRPSGQRLLTVNPPPTAFRAPDLHDSFYGSSTGASHGHAM